MDEQASPIQEFYLPLEGVPASLGPGLRTLSGAKRGAGECCYCVPTCVRTGECLSKPCPEGSLELTSLKRKSSDLDTITPVSALITPSQPINHTVVS
jgi:hypothetical protein